MFDFHPNVGIGSWVWPEADDTQFPPLEVRGLPKRKVNRPGDVVVRVSVSYEINTPQTRLNVPDAILEIDMSVPKPERGIVRSEEQTRAYGREFRRVIDQVAQQLPFCHGLHLFYAGPVSLAFHLGQQISANIHPPVTTWNFR
jgi:hypothetical protein